MYGSGHKGGLHVQGYRGDAVRECGTSCGIGHPSLADRHLSAGPALLLSLASSFRRSQEVIAINLGLKAGNGCSEVTE
jgi:hypothetical protein